MIENIDRHMEMGKPLEQAIIDAANQIVVPTLVATLCIAIVWFPLFHLSGASGYLFKPMAEAVMIAMIAFLHFIAYARTHDGKIYPQGKERTSGTVTNHRGRANLMNGPQTPPPSKPEGRHSRKSSGNVFVRFQQGFERRFNTFRDKYGERLEQAIDNRNRFVAICLIFALSSMSILFFLGRDYFPEIRSGALQMHMRAPLGTRIEVTARLTTLVSDSIKELLPGKVETIVSNCGLPWGPHNLAFIPTPTIGSQDCDLSILLTDEKSPVWDYRRILRKGLKERYPGTEFTFQPSDLTAKILNFGAPAPIDVQINGPDLYPNYEFARKLMAKYREIPGAVDVVIQQTMRTPTLFVEGNRTFGLDVNRTEKNIADNLLMTAAGSQQVDQIYWLDPSTGMSYRINVYNPQKGINSVNNLETIPVDASGTDSNINYMAFERGPLFKRGDTAPRQFGQDYTGRHAGRHDPREYHAVVRHLCLR